MGERVEHGPVAGEHPRGRDVTHQKRERAVRREALGAVSWCACCTEPCSVTVGGTGGWHGWVGRVGGTVEGMVSDWKVRWMELDTRAYVLSTNQPPTRNHPPATPNDSPRGAVAASDTGALAKDPLHVADTEVGVAGPHPSLLLV